ncbi:MAG: hypothetical protein MUE98_06110 [Rhodobacteraceae bacterium]|jgi:Ca2+-binding EF-hand superfamily protein|nr:hypothetical protein [Paracoccaceae bacterium]
MKKPLAAALAVLLAAGPAVYAQTAGEAAPEGAAPAAPAAPAQRGFAAADADGDGQVTREEAQAVRQARIAALDADGDGFVTEAELTGYHTGRAAERVAAMVSRQMQRLDADGDGRISGAEALAGGGGLSDAMFDRADADSDGAISADEMQAMRAEMREGRDRRGYRGEGRGERWSEHRNRSGHDGRWRN